MQCSSSANWSDRLCSILLLFSLSSHVLQLFDLPQLNSLLLSGLHDSHPEVVGITVKACKSILTTLIIEKKANQLQPVISAFSQLLPSLLSQQLVDLLLMAFSCFSDLAGAHALVPSDLSFLLRFSLSVAHSPLFPHSQIAPSASVLPVLRSAAASFLADAIENYSAWFVENALIPQLVACSVPCLAEGVDPRGDAVGDDDADAIVGNAFEMLLDAIGCFLPEAFPRFPD